MSSEVWKCWVSCAGLFTALFSSDSFAREKANWEKILAEDTPAAAADDIIERGWTYGLQVDAFRRIESSGTTDWQDILLKDERLREIAINNSAAVKEIIDEMAAADPSLDDRNPAKAEKICGFGLIFAELGNFSEAQAQCLRGFKLAELNSGPGSPQALACMAKTARLFLLMGDYERVQRIAEEGVNICERNDAAGLKWRALFLSLKAEAEMGRGFYKDAQESANLALREARATDSPDALALSLALVAAGRSERHRGNYGDAAKLLTEAVETSATPGSGATSDTLSRLGSDIAAVHASALQALGVLALAQGDQASLDQTIARLESHLPDKEEVFTPARAKLLLLQAASGAKKGDTERAGKYGTEYLEYVDQTLPAALGMVESQRLGWQRAFLNYSVPVAFCTPDELASHVLNWKGVVLDSMIGDRRNLGAQKTEAAIKWSEELTRCRQKLLQAQLGNSDEAGVQELKNRIFYLERKIADETRRYFNESALGAELEKVKDSLGADEVLVEFIGYKEISDPEFGESQFGAVVIARQGPARWIPLGPEPGLAALLREALSLVSSTGDRSEPVGDALSQLHEQLWSKVEAVFPPDVETVYISPDGFANFTPFACLIDSSGAMLGEKFNVAYVGSGRDLLAKSMPASNKSLQIFADPDFGQDRALLADANSAQPAERALAQTEFDKVALPPLPGTEREAAILSEVAEAAGWTPRVAMKQSATEQSLAGLRPPGILHLATHGFFLGGKSAAAPGDSLRGMTVKQAVDSAGGEAVNLPELNPMIQSGIALTGAQKTLSLWSDGQAPDPADDGILTALDVAGLDLKGTWLVTLSACETGVGEAKSGEGVFGLKRAFMMAGAQNLLMTLWPVSDETTPQIMGDFYRDALNSGNAAEAFGRTQRQWLSNLKKERGLHAAVREAGPFAMVVMANPQLKSTEVIRSDAETLEQRREESRKQQESMPKQQDFDRLDKIFE
jgi:CHAT domain-containing protein